MQDSDKLEGAAGFCESCGHELEPGMAFCTNCGAYIGVAPDGESSDASPDTSETVEGAPLEADTTGLDVVCADVVAAEAGFQPASVKNSAQEDALSREKKMKVAFIAAAGVIAALVVVIVFMLVNLQKPADSVQQPEAQQQLDAGDGGIAENAEGQVDSSSEEVDLPHTYTMEYVKVGDFGDTFPRYTFEYPDGWSVGGNNQNGLKGAATINKTDDVFVHHYRHAGAEVVGSSATFENVEKVDDAEFSVEGTAFDDLGDFVVVKGDAVGSAGTDSFYALLPESALESPEDINMSLGMPAFEFYGGTNAFVFKIADGVDEQTESEAIAILANVTFDQEENSEVMANYSDEEDMDSPDGYVLEDSSSHYYTPSELSEMTDYELYIARNEIFARHGRMFDNQDLMNHFSKKTWYEPLYSPSQFNQGVLNACEKANIELMAQIEQRRNSPYVD